MKFNRKDDTAPAATGGEVPTASDSLAPPAPETDPENQPAAPETSPETAQIEPAHPEPAHTGPDHQAGLTGKGRVRRTRVSALWIGLVVAATLAIFLLIFIAQNSDDVTIAFLGWEGQIPLAVAMLLTAVVAVLVVAVPGSLRIGQLRRALRKNAKS